MPSRLGLSRLPLRRPTALRGTGTDVWLFTGCVMDAWLRDVHVATARVLQGIGVTYAVPGAGGGCCGALHVHAGLTAETHRLARNVMASMPGDAPIVVNSAGCGAALKDYGHLLGTDEAKAFAARVLDVHEFVARHADRLTPVRRLAPVIVQDPCHLRHVQRTHLAVRTVLARVADVVELDDDGLCCGAGGAYSALEPELAGQIRERKLASIARAGGADGARIVASGEPGLCDAPPGRRRRGPPPDAARRRGARMSDYDDLAERLEAIVADLDERQFDMLREAARERTGRPADDKRLTQARRSIEKAIHLLRDDRGRGDDD